MKGGESMKEKKALQPFEIQPLNDDVLANLSIEELEERLEMQILHINEAQWCFIDICGCDGNNCNQCGSNTCSSNCNTNACAECLPLCNFNGTCIVDEDGDGQGGSTGF
jgi:hypothetical protein